MSKFLQLHESPDEFRQALSFTAAETGFAQWLIEKDYYCSLILDDFGPLFEQGFVFKGGTSISKYHAGFYRLSEDLDFAFSVATDARRAARRKAVAPVRQHLNEITERLPTISTVAERRGHDDYRQYNATLRYESVVTGEHQTVKFQVALREPIIENTISCSGRTLLRHPMFPDHDDDSVPLRVLPLRETYAEKVRAALTRRPPAIRDIYDIDDAVQSQRCDLTEPEFLALVQQKLDVPRNATVDVSHERRKALVDQLESKLKPVLRGADYSAFDVQRAFKALERIAAALSVSGTTGNP
jgi:predicted nucleotidyltransferase component of viral defense system